MKKTVLLLIVVIFSAFIVGGCVDKLGVVDLSGRVNTQPCNDGWAYRTIAAASFQPYSVDPLLPLGNYQNQLEIYKIMTIGTTDYVFVNQFANGSQYFDAQKHSFLYSSGDWRRAEKFQTLVYSFASQQRIPTIIAKNSDSGNSWENRLDDPHGRPARRELGREGEITQYFRDPETSFDLVVSSNYSISSTVTRKTDKAGNPIIKDGQTEYETISVKGSSEVNLGARQCLKGAFNVADQTITFYVLDWDFDGRFTENDQIYSDYTDKYYEFGKVLRLTNSFDASRDNTYRLHLIKPQKAGEPFAVGIELVAHGKPPKTQ